MMLKSVARKRAYLAVSVLFVVHFVADGGEGVAIKWLSYDHGGSSSCMRLERLNE